MKFHINKLILWQKNNKLRTLDFENNKINIITGESGTGKSEIISIIDYCFFSSKVDITEVKINENVNWYGINFTINDKNYTIARYRIDKGKNSDKYYFSAIGNIPRMEEIEANNTEATLKPLLEAEFGINEKTLFPYGGSKIKLGSKISFRYFLMFNIVSDSIIDNKDYFFDTRNDVKYREALDRIFDLVMGIMDEEDLLIREELQNNRVKLNTLERRKDAQNKAKEDARNDIQRLVQKASHLGLLKIDENQTDFNFLKSELHRLLSNKQNFMRQDDRMTKKVNTLIKQRNEKIKYNNKLNIFLNDYENYIKLLSNEEQSIATANLFSSEFQEVYELPEAKYLLNILNYELKNIKEAIVESPKVKKDIRIKIKTNNELITSLEDRIKLLKTDLLTSNNILEKQWMFLGELTTKLEYIDFKSNYESNTEEMNILEDEIKKLEKKLEEYPQKKANVLSVLNELIQDYLDNVKESLGDYSGYLADFNYTHKTLELRKPKSIHTTKVGSSSNHMFLHLSLFLGIQEYLIELESNYVPSWLILDQPSRPYFGEGELSDTLLKPETDNAKIKNMLNVLVNFAKKINEEMNKEFQIILLEHVPKDFWINDNYLMSKIHLVEEFKDGNALVKV